MTHKERFMKLQQDVLGAVKHAIQINAPGLPVVVVTGYVRQVGGDVMAVDETMDITKFEDSSPFRLCITTKERPDFEKATTVVIVDKVIGWG